jgi:peptidoglycan hydrolase FlgJ
MSLQIASNPNYAAEIQRAKSAGLLPKGTPENKKAWETAQGLEANFFQTMIGTMFQGLEGEGMMGTKATGQETWRGMLIEQYGQSIAGKGGIGLTPAIYREMLRNQESRPHAAQQPGT